MIPVTQTEFGNGNGNCWAACLASLMELPISEVPNFCKEYPKDWWAKTVEWLAAPLGKFNWPER